MVEVPTPARRCPNCDHNHETAWDPHGREIRPSAGDWTICFNCGQVMRFGRELSLVPATKTDVLTAPAAVKIDLIFAAQVVIMLKRHRRVN